MSASLDEDGKQAWTDAVKTLAYFSHRDAARELCDGVEEALISKQRLAENRLQGFNDAMAIYAHMGRILAQSFADIQPHVRELKLGRNDPCFCGRGKKYERCCLNA